MNKINTLPRLLQLFITEEEMIQIALKHGYIETARKFNFVHLINFWSVAATETWSGYREAEAHLPNYPEVPSVDHSTLAKKAKNVPFQVMRDIFQLLIKRMNRSLRRSFVRKYKLYAIDSTTITFKHPNYAWARYSSCRHAIRLHTLFDILESQPTNVIETTGRDHDIMVAPKLFSVDDPSAVFIGDRGYASTAIFEQLEGTNKQFVIRIADAFTASHKKSLKRLRLGESNIIEDETAGLGKGSRQTKNRYRLVTFRDAEGNKIRVATNLMDCSAEAIAAFYKARWQIELFFRWVKQNLELSNVFGTSENAVYSQVFGTLISYLLLRWLFNETQSAWRKICPLNFLDFSRRFIQSTLPTEVRAEIQWFHLNRRSLLYSDGKY
ncbi:IS4 family transposase [Alkalihalobacillus sp. MEB130]|uniref:IS4 family transposase n=1 Tax=Alkalihalobacillus sp. MEB130 TaxID=2976704 RepID=UPI0028DE8E13|nr:IS4 family transposase [Alkalihalobacillus sp. MEB130]MDT8863105.1 IS4 family transposase [Alkalihalobacillus sp. MEB130]